MIDRMKLICGSSTRLAAMLALLDGPKTTAQIAEGLDGPEMANIATAIRPLIKDDTILRDKRDLCSLSQVGRQEAMLLRGMMKNVAVLQEHRDFFGKHDLLAIPDDLLREISSLSGGHLVTAAPDDPLASQKAFIGAVSTAKEFYGISCVDGLGYSDMIVALVRAGSHVELILTRPVIEKIDREALQAVMSCPNFQLYEIDSCHLGFTVTDRLSSLAMCFPDGRYDPQEDLICEGAEAVEWGRRLYEFYKSKSHKY